MDQNDIDRIRIGEGHCLIGAGFLECKLCGERVELPMLREEQPIWVMLGLMWGFSYEHGDCASQDSKIERTLSSSLRCQIRGAE